MKKIPIKYVILFIVPIIVILIFVYSNTSYEMDFSCNTNDDCVLGIRLDECCSCPQVYSKRDIERDVNLEAYGYENDYAFVKTIPCNNVLCEMCLDVYGAVCSNNICQEPKTTEELLEVCPSVKNEDIRNNCYIFTAKAAYNEIGLDRAKELCNIEYLNKTISSPNIVEREFCLGEVGRMVLERNPNDIVDFCFDNLDRLQSRCMKEAGETIAETDIESGVRICGKISIRYDGDVFQKDACYHNVAVIARKTNETRALELCEMMSTKVDDCKDLIKNYCSMYIC